MSSQSEFQELTARGTDNFKSYSKGGEDKMSQLNSKAGKEKEKFPSPFIFCCIQANNGLDDAHPNWRGQSTLNPPIQMLRGDTPVKYNKHLWELVNFKWGFKDLLVIPDMSYLLLHILWTLFSDHISCWGLGNKNNTEGSQTWNVMKTAGVDNFAVSSHFLILCKLFSESSTLRTELLGFRWVSTSLTRRGKWNTDIVNCSSI